MLIRQTAPVFGAAGSSPYAKPGEWQINLSFRGLQSDTHYRLDERQVERETLGTFVINRQHAADASVTYAISERFSLAAAVPFINASWSIPSPTTPTPGPRAQEDARGIGDVSVSGRYWLFDTETHRRGNIAAGLGLKMPTGNARSMDTFPDRNGQNGNVVLSAHNDVYGELFRYLDKLAPGDQVVLYTQQRQYVYVVDRTAIVEPTAVEVMASTGSPTVTLISCYPYLVNKQRIVVFARLQN